MEVNGFWLGVFFALVLVFCVLIYISYRYVEYFEGLLPGSALVRLNKRNFACAGLPGKVVRTSTIALILSVPKFAASKSLIDIREVNDVPVGVRFLLVGIWFIMVFLIAAAMFFAYSIDA